MNPTSDPLEESKTSHAYSIAAAIAVGALLLAIYFFNESASEEKEAQSTRIENQEPDTYGERVRYRQLRADGSMQYQLNAQSIRQYEKQELTHMQTPKLHLTSATSAPWDIRAERGILNKKTAPDGQPEDVVFLRNNVEMAQAHPTNGELVLRSEAFYIFPNRNFAQTHEDVMIDTEVGRTRAAGLTADLGNGVLHLVSRPGLPGLDGQPRGKQRVHTIILPEQFKKKSS